ncbi:phage virion morphogenesis protein [Pseudomonas sp. LB1P83]
MNNHLEALEDWASGLLEQLEPASRNRLGRSLGQTLRQSQQQRIIAQRNPDGSKYVRRKKRCLRGGQGRVKLKVKMLKKLRTANFMKAHGHGGAISVGFTGRNARIAMVHQYGLRDSAERGAVKTKYEKREALGFTEADFDLIKDHLFSHLIQ